MKIDAQKRTEHSHATDTRRARLLPHLDRLEKQLAGTPGDRVNPQLISNAVNALKFVWLDLQPGEDPGYAANRLTPSEAASVRDLTLAAIAEYKQSPDTNDSDIRLNDALTTLQDTLVDLQAIREFHAKDSV